MNIIEELIHDLSQANPNISDALLKTKILLFKLGQKDLAEWVNHELNGYPGDTAVPEYRVTQGVLKGVITNGYWTYNDQVLPTSHLPDTLRDRFERKIELREPISVLQEIGGHGKAIHFQVPIEINHLIGEALDDGAWVLQSNCQLGLGVPTRVTTQVRSRLIDFLLELREEFGDDATNADIVSMAKDKNIEGAFNSAIFGDNTTIVIGDGNRLKVKNSVLKNDFESLRNALKSNGILDADISALSGAIEEDGVVGPEQDQKKFGPKVSQWIGEMMSKAASASWQIELSIAANLLTDALKSYYGWH